MLCQLISVRLSVRNFRAFAHVFWTNVTVPKPPPPITLCHETELYRVYSPSGTFVFSHIQVCRGSLSIVRGSVLEKSPGCVRAWEKLYRLLT